MVKFPPLLVSLSPPDPLDAGNFVEMGIAAQNGERVLPG
jgi:hypothetical protein